MANEDWFEIERPGAGDNPDDFWTFGDEEEAFVAVVRERTRHSASEGGWVQVKGLPPPEVYVHVRGDLDAAVIPDGARGSTSRGGLPALWYE